MSFHISQELCASYRAQENKEESVLRTRGDNTGGPPEEDNDVQEAVKVNETGKTINMSSCSTWEADDPAFDCPMIFGKPAMITSTQVTEEVSDNKVKRILGPDSIHTIGGTKRVREEGEPGRNVKQSLVPKLLPEELELPSSIDLVIKPLPKLRVVKKKDVPEPDKAKISRSSMAPAPHASAAVVAEWRPARANKETVAKRVGVSNDLRKWAAETARKTEQMCDLVDAERKRDSETLAQALKDYESEKRARIAAESKAKKEGIDFAKTLNNEVEKGAAAETRLKEEVEKRTAAEDRCGTLEKKIAALDEEKTSALSREVVVVKRLDEEYKKRILAEDEKRVALEKCAALEERIADLQAQKRTRHLSKSVVVKQEIMSG